MVQLCIYANSCLQDVIRSTDHKVVQQSSKIRMLNAELKTLRKQYEQLIGIHTRYKSQEQSSTASQTDQVAKYCNCCKLQRILTIFMSTYISTGICLVDNSYNVTEATQLHFMY